MNGSTKYPVFSGAHKKDKHVNKYGTKAQKDNNYNINWHDLEHDVADKLWNIHLHDSIASQCRDYLLSYLGTQIEFTQGDKIITPSPEFDRILKSEWAPFIRDLFDTMFILGIAPITFQKTQSSDIDYIPVVLRRE